MAKPRNVKQAMEDGRYKATKIYAKGSKKIRVTFTPRFYGRGENPIVEFWINRDYFARNYPKTYERL